jgi:hypothetical protein
VVPLSLRVTLRLLMASDLSVLVKPMPTPVSVVLAPSVTGPV